MTPRDWDRCTVEEEDHLLGWVEQYKAQMDKNARKPGRS